MASESVKNLVREIIAKEDPRKPYSDEKLVQILQGDEHPYRPEDRLEISRDDEDPFVQRAEEDFLKE